MSTFEFRRWCDRAVSGIVFPPDRQKVYRELMNHLEDHYDTLRETGYCEDIAVAMTVEAMGDALEIAPQLAAIHRPFWGKLLYATRAILVIAAIITVIPLLLYAWETVYYPPMWTDWNVFSEASYGGDTGRTLLHLSEPDVRRTSDGYTFTLTNAVHWYSEESGSSCFFIYMEEFHPLPWAAHGEAGSWFWAEDNLGNQYACDYSRLAYDTPTVYSKGSQTSLFTCTYAMWINDHVPLDAEWIDIRYTRDGRNLAFRVNLTGGDGA